MKSVPNVIYLCVLCGLAMMSTLPVFCAPLPSSGGMPVTPTPATRQEAPDLLQFTTARLVVTEGDVATVMVTRTGNSRGSVKVDYCAYTGGWDTAFAVAPEVIDTANGAAGDYVPCRSRIRNLGRNPVGWPYNIAAAGTLVFQYGETRKSFSVTTRTDGIIEGDETLTMVLRNPQGSAVLGAPADAKLVIVDADAPAAGVVQFNSPLNHVKGGGAGSTTIMVTRTGGSRGTISVAYTTVAADISYYSDKTLTKQQVAVPRASAGVEYTNVAGVLTWADGDATPKIITVPILACNATGIKNVALTLSKPTGGAQLGTCRNADLYIVCPSPDNVYTLCNRNAFNHLPKDGEMYQITGVPIKVWLPRNTAVIAGVLLPVNMADRQTQVLCQEWGFAQISITQMWDTAFEGEDPTQIASLEDLLKQVAAATLHPEIANAPIATQSFSSLGGGCSACLANPDRALGFTAISGGHLKNSGPFEKDPYEPFFSHSTMTEGARSVPGIFIDGDLDKVLDPGTGLTRDVLIETYFTALRTQRGLTAFAVDWNTGHGGGEGAKELGWLFLAQVINMRNPNAWLPGIQPGERVPLRTITEQDGWLGEKPTLDTAKTSSFLTIAPVAEYAGGKGVLSSWLPTAGVAHAYRALSSRNLPYAAKSPFQTPVMVSSPTSGQILPPGNVEITVDPRTYTNIAQMDCFDETGIRLGQLNAPPWRFSGTFTPGLHAVSIVTTDNNNRTVATSRVFVCDLTGIQPPTVTSPASLTVNNGQTATLTVTATGAAPFRYQWQKDGWIMRGANQATLTIPAAHATDAGAYTVIVSNAAGNTQSAVATLTVKP